MPTTASMRMSHSTDAWERTVLFPTKASVPSTGETTPQAGTSARRQFLIQTTGPRMRPRKILEFPADLGEVTLGKARDCHYRVDEVGVADVHAALIRRVNRGVYLVDLSEGGSTLLNGDPVREEVLLMDGDRITLGDALQFEFLDGPRPRIQGWAKRVLSRAGVKKSAL